jgi:NADH dehydrogenase/NADH:ubiquinone oxidoreductase subunit G
VVGDDLTDIGKLASPGSLSFFLHLTSGQAHAAATLAFPISTHAEIEGTWINRDGRVQRFWPGLKAPGEASPAWRILHDLLARVSEEVQDAPSSAAEAFAVCAVHNTGFAGLDWAHLGVAGAPLSNQGEV